ncbi:MAG: polysaccharide biosynthesis protein [Clostridiales bacterium]|nr:polysaccharide biosynthesis protein [Clostridiales bacterium]
MEKGKIIKGAFILTGANIITRLIGFFYRVYMAELIGAEGMGLYQLIVPVYMLVWSISSSGFSTVISKLTASEKAAGRNPVLILRLSALLSVSTGFILGAAVYFNSDFIAQNILKDIRTALSLKLICFCFPFMALGSCIRGYFFGMQNSLPPAVSQVVEQITRMTVIFLIGNLLIPKGIEYACAAAVTGMCVGEIVSGCYIFLSLLSKPKGHRYNKTGGLVSACGLILAMVIPLTLNRLVSSLLSAAENILIPLRLQLYGLSKTDAVSEFGRLSGMAMPLIMFPSSFLTAVSITVVPAISESCASKNSRAVKAAAEKSVLFASITGFGAAGLFLTLSDEISSLIYGNSSVGDMLFMLGFLCPCMYLNVMLTGILNGMGEQISIFTNGLAGSLICLAFVWFAVPRLGIYGYIFGSLAALVLTSALNLYRVNKNTALSLSLSDYLLKPLLSAALPCLICLKLKETAVLPLAPPLQTIALCLFIGISFTALLILTGAVKKSDVTALLSPVLKNRRIM